MLTIDQRDKLLAYYDKHAWIQHDMYIEVEDKICGACLVGAAMLCFDGDDERLANVFDALREAAGVHVGMLDVWNDEHGRTKAEVITLIHKAAGTWD